MWVPITGYGGRYEITADGQVKSVARTVLKSNGQRQRINERLLTCPLDAHGYPVVTLTKDSVQTQYLVHRLVAQEFIGPCPDGYEVAHNDGNRANPQVSNLRYATRRENIADQIGHGTATRRDQSKCRAGLHEWVLSNLIRKDKYLTCKACYRATRERVNQKRRAARAAARNEK